MAKSGCHLFVHILYSFFLLLSGTFLIVAAAAPFWLLAPTQSGDTTGYACGIFSECQDKEDLSCNIEVYGDSISAIPTQALRVAAGLLIVSMIIVWLSFLVSLISCCFCYQCTKIQIPALTIASILMVGALLAFGYAMEDFNLTVFDTNGLNCNCGASAEKFQPGNCELGYGAALAITATILISISGCIAEGVKRRDIENDLYE